MSPYTSKEWAFTCSKCPYIPEGTREEISERFQVDGSVSYVMIDTEQELGVVVNPYYPKRCKDCERAKKRDYNTRKGVGKVYSMSAGIGCFNQTYNYPKLITFALMDDYYQTETPYEIRKHLVDKLNKKLPAAIKLLKKRGTLGGTFVLECSTKLVWSDLATEPQMWRHHPHVHMVAVSNFVHYTKLKQYSEMLLPLGLGRIHLKAPKGQRKVSNYIGKYLAKDGFRRRTFGIMRKVPKWEENCKCLHEDMEINANFCECITG